VRFADISQYILMLKAYIFKFLSCDIIPFAVEYRNWYDIAKYIESYHSHIAVEAIMKSERKAKIFISRRHADEPIAKILALILPLDCQLIVDELEPGLGKSIKGKILSLIEQSTHMIVIWSEASRSSPWVNQEIGAALHKGIPVIPLIQHDIPTEAMLEGIEGVIYDPKNELDGIIKLIDKLGEQLKKEGYPLLDKYSAKQRLVKTWDLYQKWQKYGDV
jgi:hypothetical protein